MPKNKSFNFPDQLLSTKLLTFAKYPNQDTRFDEIDLKIAQNIYHYTDRAPVYYQSTHSASALHAFIHSDSHIHLMKEFEICINYLNDWVQQEAIVFQSDTNNTTGESNLIAADVMLSNFLMRMQNDEFSLHRTFIYSEGKKNLEIIAILTRDESISLEFRKQTIITLLNDEGLMFCSGACLASLSDAAESLKSYGNFSATCLIKIFVGKLAREIALKNNLFNQDSYSERICCLANCLIQDYEIHAMHYLLEKLKLVLNIDFFILSQDPYIKTLQQNLKGKQSELDTIFINFFNEFQRQFNATNLVKFLSDLLYDACLVHLGDYYSMQVLIETQLKQLGEDPDFIWSEIFTEGTNLKKADTFLITIAERLRNSDWLNLPPKPLDLKSRFQMLKTNISELFQIGHLQNLPEELLESTLRIYPNNLTLTWVEMEDKRQALIDVLGTEEGFNWLNKNVFAHSENLKALLQNLNDMVLFFEHLPLEHHFSMLKKLAFNNFDMASVIFDKIDKSINFQAFYNLLTSLSDEGKQFFVRQYYKAVYSVLEYVFDGAAQINYNKIFMQLQRFIAEIISAGFRDFTGIHFKESSKYPFVLKKIGYLNNLDFSGATLVNVTFAEPISKCSFTGADLQKATFIDIGLSRCDFRHAKLLNCEFKRTSLSDVNFSNANLVNTRFSNADLSYVDFIYANLAQVDFPQTDLVKVNFQKAKLSGIRFDEAELFNTNFSEALLDGIDFNNAEIFGANFNTATLQNVDFSKAEELVGISLRTAKITKIIVAVSQLFILYKQRISDFSLVGLAQSWRGELILDPKNHLDYYFLFNATRYAPGQHFFCNRRNFSCLEQEPLRSKRLERQNLEKQLLKNKLTELKLLSEKPLEEKRLEKQLLKIKFGAINSLKWQLLENEVFINELSQIELAEDESSDPKLSESFSNVTESTRRGIGRSMSH